MTFKDRPDLDPGEQNRARIGAKAVEHGWSVVSRDPGGMTLTKGERSVQISFNGAGNPTSATWGGGDEFNSMPATGYMDMNILLNHWLPWEQPRDEESDE